MRATLRRVNSLARQFDGLSPEALAQRYQALRGACGGRGTAAQALALACAAFRRGLGLAPYPEQIIGALAMARGQIAQLQTGEGKTVSAVLTACVWALEGTGVHIATVNPYLARRDAEWMGPVYQALGLRVGVIEQGMKPPERRAAYACDVVYGIHSEFGFDYLRDRLARDAAQQVQPAPAHMLVDEADSVLLDEATTPLLLSGAGGEDDGHALATIDRFVRWLKPCVVDALEDEGDYYDLNQRFDYVVESRRRLAFLTERGQRNAERYFRLDSLDGDVTLSHRIYQSLQAHGVFRRDVDYLVRENRLMIIDPNTGRLMEGRRYCDGLWQALMAKEGLPIPQESVTLASISFQQFFRRYPVLAGMTGTACDGRDELRAAYGLSVRVVRPHRPCRRRELPTVVCATQEDKLRLVAREARESVARRQPCLIVTRTVAENDALHAAFDAMGLAHQVLSARHHAEEAAVIAQAGRAGCLTLATAMAGRGTDIRLDEEACALGGLYVIGYGRQDTRRGDRQLIGRCARQGEPGQSRFFVAEDDELMRLFAHGRLNRGSPRARERVIRAAQREYESLRAADRRLSRELDAVIAIYRERVYAWRDAVLRGSRPADVPPQVNLARLRRVALPLLDAAWAGFLSDAREAQQQCGVVSMTGRDYRSEYLHAMDAQFRAMAQWLESQIAPRMRDEAQSAGEAD